MSLPTATTPAMLDTVLDHLAPHFLAANDDRPAARYAAGCLLAAYQTRTDAELELAVTIVSFSMHALEALSDAAAPDLTLNQKLRLRSSAVNLSREGHKARRKLDQLVRARAAAAGTQQADAAAESPASEPAIPADSPVPTEPAGVGGPAITTAPPAANNPCITAEPAAAPEAQANRANPAAATPVDAPLSVAVLPTPRPHQASRHGVSMPALSRAQQQRQAAEIIAANLRRNAALAAQASATPPQPAPIPPRAAPGPMLP